MTTNFVMLHTLRHGSADFTVLENTYARQK